ASPSPASDGTNVYVFFAELGLISYTADGQERWRLPLGPFESFYGMGGSPVVSGDTLVLVCDQRRGSFIVAVDTRNGHVRWRKSRNNPVEAFTTPVVHTPADGAAQVIVFGSPLLEAYALADGARLWWVRRVGSYPVGVPALTGDMVFVSSQGADEPPIPPFDAALSKFDTNTDGLLQAAEMLENPEIGEHFGWMDRNSNGSTDQDEYDFVRSSMAFGHGLTAVRLRPGTGDVTASHVAWQIKKHYPYMPAPLFYDGVLYTVKTGGIVLSVHPGSGDVFKMGRLEGAPGGYVSSPVAGDGKLFMVSAECKVSVLRAVRQWELLAVTDLADECWATPAIASGRIFLRTRRTLYAFAQKSAKPLGPPVPLPGR
ncbi:MAG: PQQ-binding-like beta-propeller repeat protein, partial [Chloroflexota bacterium]